MSLLKKVILGASVILIVGLMCAAYMYMKIMGIITNPAGYDHEPPAVPEFARPAILVLSKANGYVHEDALPAGEKMLKELADQEGWDIFTTDNAATHNSEDLAKFRVVVWNNVSGDVLTTEQRSDFKYWVEQGGGWVGIHASGGDLHYKWDWYADTLVGAQFVGHTMNPQFQNADLLVADSSIEVTSHLKSPWTVSNEEWYAFDKNPRDEGYEILLTLDKDSYQTKQGGFIWREQMKGEHPIAWRYTIGEGRSLYSAIGHQGPTYSIPEFRQFITNAVRWVGKL